eukprot:6195106-Pleurochrysis_carterae.AAC.4
MEMQPRESNQRSYVWWACNSLVLRRFAIFMIIVHCRGVARRQLAPRHRRLCRLGGSGVPPAAAGGALRVQALPERRGPLWRALARLLSLARGRGVAAVRTAGAAAGAHPLRAQHMGAPLCV